MAQDLFLYETLCEQLAVRIRRGGFAPGERLPSVRALSKAFGVRHCHYPWMLEDRAVEQLGFIRTPVAKSCARENARVWGFLCERH